MFVFLFICAVIIFLVYTQTKMKSHKRRYKNMGRAIGEGSSVLPTWINNNKKVNEFLLFVKEMSVDKGVPRDYAENALSSLTGLAVALAHCAGEMEKQGSSFGEQKFAASELFYELWTSADDEKRKAMLKEI